MISFISYTRPPLKDWKRWLLYLMHRNPAQSRKMKKQRKIFKMKKKIKPQKKTLMKWR